MLLLLPRGERRISFALVAVAGMAVTLTALSVAGRIVRAFRLVLGKGVFVDFFVFEGETVEFN